MNGPILSLGTYVRYERQQRGLRLADLARMTGIATSYLSEIERDQADPSMGVLRRLAAQIEVPLTQLLHADASGVELVSVPADRYRELLSTEATLRRVVEALEGPSPPPPTGDTGDAAGEGER